MAAYGYDVFGALRSGSPGATDFLFTGEQRDADSDMYYLRARHYDPETGRFLSQDPLPLGNLYAYVGNNPVNRVDPSGLMHIADVGGVRPKEGGGFDFDRLCPNRDPNRIYIIDDGVCYDITPDPCKGVNPLLCGSGEKGLFGFQPEKPLSDAWDWIKGCETCGRIGMGVLVYMECVADPRVQMTAMLAGGAFGPEAYVVVAGGGCVAVVAIDQTTNVNPLHPETP